MLKLEKATDLDLVEVLVLVKEFHDETLAQFGLGFDAESAMATIEMFHKDHVHLVAKTEEGKIVGVIAGSIAPHFLNYKVKMFVESIWYIRKEYRGGSNGPRLYLELENFCDRNDLVMLMVNMANEHEEKISAFYEKRGFIPLEKHHIRRPL